MSSVTIGLGPKLDPKKFRDPDYTARGEPRAEVPLGELETLWFNTGTLCNLSCDNCYIESSPRNDRLVYLSASEVDEFLHEAIYRQLGTSEIGFTGGEPFMNPDLINMLENVLSRGFKALVLTNGMRPLMKCSEAVLSLYPREKCKFRISLDHFTREGHERIRGKNTWKPALQGLKWLCKQGFPVSVASRTCWTHSEDIMRKGFYSLFAKEKIAIDASNPSSLVLFPEMDDQIDVPEITESCWNVLGISPSELMCSRSRVVLKRKGDPSPVVSPCTLLPYEEAYDFGSTLASAQHPVKLNHPHCSKFCVLGGASCSSGPNV
ncbi:MAG: radical SAM protein [Rhodospirillaceae bacterium]|nr:radical SAM protein [Rhodospirillaceae bacterium]|tara:strand:+ start:307 stop:1269 length:963 start_codon:yes stop_codon:yes gene_type:complete